MHKSLSLLTLVAGVLLGTQVQAHGLQFSGHQCGFSTDYDVRVSPQGIQFDRQAVGPSHVFMHDGQLRVDGSPVALSSADSARLRAYELQVRELLPQVTGLVREGLDIGFTAMTTVAATFTENDEQRQQLLQRLHRQHMAALRQVDLGIGSGVWKQREVQSVVEEGVQNAASEMAAAVTASAVKAALSGDEGKLAALEARADSLEKSIDREVDARADRLGREADAMCPRLGALAQLQQQFQFRLHDGTRLILLAHDSGDGVGTVAVAR